MMKSLWQRVNEPEVHEFFFTRFYCRERIVQNLSRLHLYDFALKLSLTFDRSFLFEIIFQERESLIEISDHVFESRDKLSSQTQMKMLGIRNESSRIYQYFSKTQ